MYHILKLTAFKKLLKRENQQYIASAVHEGKSYKNNFLRIYNLHAFQNKISK